MSNIRRIQRFLTYRGNHAVELTAEELEAEFLLVTCDVITAVEQEYFNRQYSPQRSSYARVTAGYQARVLFLPPGITTQEYVIRDFQLQFPKNLIYRGYLSDIVTQRSLGAIASQVTPGIREEIEALPVTIPMALRYLLAAALGEPPADSDALLAPRPLGHPETIYRATAPEGHIFTWGITALTTDYTEGETQDDPGSGGGGNGDGLVADDPVNDPPGGPVQLTQIPPGSSLPSFFDPPGTLNPDGPVGEAGKTYHVSWTEYYLVGGFIDGSPPDEPVGTYEYRIRVENRNVPGPVLGVRLVATTRGGGNLATFAVIDFEGGTAQGDIIEQEVVLGNLLISQLANSSNQQIELLGVVITENNDP